MTSTALSTRAIIDAGLDLGLPEYIAEDVALRLTDGQPIFVDESIALYALRGALADYREWNPSA